MEATTELGWGEYTPALPRLTCWLCHKCRTRNLARRLERTIFRHTLSPAGTWGTCPGDLPSHNLLEGTVLGNSSSRAAYRDELELERLRWRRRPGERERRRTGDLRLGERDRLLMRGGERRHIGGGGSILLGGLNRLGGGRGQGASTAVAVISWPSICPPSMCFSAFSASSGFSNST